MAFLLFLGLRNAVSFVVSLSNIPQPFQQKQHHRNDVAKLCCLSSSLHQYSSTFAKLPCKYSMLHNIIRIKISCMRDRYKLFTLSSPTNYTSWFCFREYYQHVLFLLRDTSFYELLVGCFSFCWSSFTSFRARARFSAAKWPSSGRRSCADTILGT